jgi:hypothetical protein
MHQPNPHATHDATLIAGHAAGDLVDSDRTRAQALLGSCKHCAELHADLIAIADGTRALPNLAHAPRDFRLDPAQAARLRRGSWLRAALRPFGAPGFAVKPFATAFTAAGVAGLLVVTVLPAILGSGSAAGPQRDQITENQSIASAAPVAVGAPGVAGAPAPTSAAIDRSEFGANSAASPGSDQPVGVKNGPGATGDTAAVLAGGLEATPTGMQPGAAAPVEAPAQPNPILIGSIVMLGVGLGLFGLRFASRRLR